MEIGLVGVDECVAGCDLNLAAAPYKCAISFLMLRGHSDVTVVDSGLCKHRNH